MSLDYFILLLTIISFNFFGSALGLFISGFFETMSKAMGALYFAVLVLALPTISYIMPSFRPGWIRFLPSCPMMFSFREILTDNSNPEYIYIRTYLYFLCWQQCYSFLHATGFELPMT